MDEELASTHMSKSFASPPTANDTQPVPSSSSAASSTAATTIDSSTSTRYQPVDVNYNLMVNLVESVSSQGGAAGPTTNLLGDIGVAVPQDWFVAEDTTDEAS